MQLSLFFFVFSSMLFLLVNSLVEQILADVAYQVEL